MVREHTPKQFSEEAIVMSASEQADASSSLRV